MTTTLTVREQAAIAAMAALIACERRAAERDSGDIAIEAVRYADDLVLELEGGNP
jgi:hypothetical protein